MQVVESEVSEALRRLEMTVADGASYESAVAALHACNDTADADRAAQAIAEWRVTLALHYERSADECEAALLDLLGLELSLLDRASKMLAVCATHTTLSERYLPSLIAELATRSDEAAISRLLITARRIYTGS